MKPKPDSDDMGVSIARTIIGTAFIITGVAVITILLIAAFCKL